MTWSTLNVYFEQLHFPCSKLEPNPVNRAKFTIYRVSKRTANQQRGFPLRKYFIPVCVGRGLALDFESSFSVCAGGVWKSGNLGILSLWDRAQKNRLSNDLGHNRSTASRIWAETESSCINCSRSCLAFMTKNHNNG